MSIETIKSMMIDEIQREEKVANYMKRRLKGLPAGSLCVNRINDTDYYYHKMYIEGKQKSFILDPTFGPHSEAIKELMEKKTIVHGLPILKRNILVMSKSIDELKEYHPANYRYGHLLWDVYYLDDDVCIRSWREKPDSQNDAFRENMIHKTKSGKMVRSKSEVLIADSLYDAKLEFKSEAALGLINRTVYPDFEILHPKTHKLIWWEHLGLVSDQEYVCENIEKIIEYGRAGIIPGKNLIITYETKEKPLTHEVINQRLKEFDLI